MALSDLVYLDAIVFSAENELDHARQFCKELGQIMLSNGQNVKIKTFEDFSHPGKTDTGNIDDAVRSARYKFISPLYYQEGALAQFTTEVCMTYDQALNHNRDGFIRMLNEKASKENHCKDLERNPSFSTYFVSSLKITDWKLDSYMKEKLVKLFEDGRSAATQLSEIQLQQQNINQQLESCLEIWNGFISSSTLSEETHAKDFFLASNDLVEDNESSLASGQAPEDASRAIGNSENTDQATGNPGDTDQATDNFTTRACIPFAIIKSIPPMVNSPPRGRMKKIEKRRERKGLMVNSPPRGRPYTLDDIGNDLL